MEGSTWPALRRQLHVAQAIVLGGSLELPPLPSKGCVEPDGLERAVERDVQPPVAVEEEQQAERDEHRRRSPPGSRV